MKDPIILKPTGRRPVKINNANVLGEATDGENTVQIIRSGSGKICHWHLNSRLKKLKVYNDEDDFAANAKMGFLTLKAAEAANLDISEEIE